MGADRPREIQIINRIPKAFLDVIRHQFEVLERWIDPLQKLGETVPGIAELARSAKNPAGPIRTSLNSWKNGSPRMNTNKSPGGVSGSAGNCIVRVPRAREFRIQGRAFGQRPRPHRAIGDYWPGPGGVAELPGPIASASFPMAGAMICINAGLDMRFIMDAFIFSCNSDCFAFIFSSIFV